MTTAGAETPAIVDWPVMAVLDEQRLRGLVPTLRQTFAVAEPVGHVVIDDFFVPGVAERLVREFPGDDERDWLVWDTAHELKSTSKGPLGLEPFTRYVLSQLNASSFVRFLEDVTGIDGLIPDPHFFGAGLHETRRGGWLDVHADYATHPHLDLTRVLNLIVYLNDDWDPAWGGNLELWDRGVGRVAEIQPLFNRALLFVTDADALHGHPTPLDCPPDRTRKSLSVYYWVAPVGGKAPENARVVWFDGRATTTAMSYLTRLKRAVPPQWRRRLRRLRGRARV